MHVESFSPFSVSHTHSHTHTHTHTQYGTIHTHSLIRKCSQIIQQCLWPLFSVVFDAHGWTAHHPSLTDPLKGWFPVTNFILSPFTAVICVSHCLRVCVSCLSQSTVAGCPIVCQLPVPPCHQSITSSTPAFCPTAYSAVYPCQLSVLPSLSVISMSLLPPLSVISLSLLTPLSVISLSLLTPMSVISPPQLSNPWSALAVYTIVNVGYLTCLSHYFSCGWHFLNCHLSVMLSIQLSKMPTANQTVWKKNVSIPLSKC